ncbi:Transferase [Sesbania bispinosa]|nr:Transferase [Sesbania bispinosa]
MELISRETIKPSTPTPPNLTIYPLSLIDNMVAPNAVPLVYFYPNQSYEYDHNIDTTLTQGQVYDHQGPKILALKNSLSKVLSIYYPLAEFVFVKQKTVTRRLVFRGSKIESLKAMVSSHKVENPSRVEVVIALIYKCVVSALGLTANNTTWRVVVNLRKRMVPPLPEKSVGNLVLSFFASNMEKREIELHDVVSRTREGLFEFCEKYVKNFGDVSFVSGFLNRATSTSTSVSSPQEKKTSLFFTSWCRLGMYETDFGWGKPIWVTTCGCPVRNTIILLDTKDGDGVEAVVNMEGNDMARFECDVELLQYASLNPNQWAC